MATARTDGLFERAEIGISIPTPEEEARADAAASAIDPSWDDQTAEMPERLVDPAAVLLHLDQEVEAARSGDELLIAIRPSPAEMPGPEQKIVSFERTTTDGRQIVVSAGTVEFINMPGRTYDHKITVGINDGLLVERLGGATRVSAHPTTKPHAFIQSETVTRRRNGDPIAELLLRKEGRGELRQLAVKLLTAESGSGGINLTSSALRDLREPLRPERPAAPLDPVEVALDAYEATDARSLGGRSGFGYRRAIQQALAAKGLAHSPSTAKALLARLRAEGRIPAATRGRPSRSQEPPPRASR
jgi:hypothetical protein